MIVQVKVFASLRHHVPPSSDRLEDDKWIMPDGALVADVLNVLRLPEEEAKLILVNGRKAERDAVLAEGDVMHVFPPMCGG